jgi:hypothetical protein
LPHFLAYASGYEVKFISKFQHSFDNRARPAVTRIVYETRMQTKKLAIGLIAILLGALLWVFSSDQPDRNVVQRLTRKENQKAPTALDELTEPEMFRLTSRLVATRKEDAPYSWVIEDSESSTVVELPFAPTKEGVLPVEPVTRDSDATNHSSSNPGFMGADACAECHQENHDGFVHTAHHRTSGVVNPGVAVGHFNKPRNSLITRDPNLFFTMKHRDGRHFQEISFADWSLEVPHDVFTGSAKAGQSFLFWHQDALFQSHVSYLTNSDEWITSPGYRDTSVMYTRVIRQECLECHVTYIESKRKPNVYHRDSAIWGISCERCHGPGREHVEFHRSHAEERLAKHIVLPSDLPRERQLDICGQCHSGSFSFLGDPFSYRPGEELDQYHKLLDQDSSGVGSIHTANQLKRLEMSKCFQHSEMTCTTCHNPHEHQRGDLTAFTASCLTCHEPTACGMSEHLGEKIAENCVSCHMPIGDNEGMTLQVSRGLFTVKMIDHHIRIDQKATDEYLSR